MNRQYSKEEVDAWFPDIEVGYCPVCDESETWIIVYDDGSKECYFQGCEIDG